MELILGFGAGMLTLINPCVIPVLPVILISAMNQHRLGVYALCAGLSITFTLLGILVASVGPSFGIDEGSVTATASLAMILFGLVLIVPPLSRSFTLATSNATNQLGSALHGAPSTGLKGQFLTGVILGAVWSPCIGPTLGGAIALASEGNDIAWATMIMISFALGVSSIIIVLSTLSREALFRQKDNLQKLAPYIRPITGAILVTLGVVLWFKLHHILEIWLLENMPLWLLDLSVSI